MSKFSVLDLFCGAGGFSCGMEHSSFKVLAGIDNDAATLETFKHNHLSAEAIEYDLSNIGDDLYNQLDPIFSGGLDVLVGGPPCQGFSIAGKRLEDDPRNSLWSAYVSIVKRYNPRIIFLENVPTIMSLYNGEIAQRITNSFKSLGYETSVKILLASDYGVPQNRRRAIFVAWNSQLPEFKFPKKMDSKITNYEAISDLPLLENTLGSEISEYESPPMSDYQRLMRSDSSKLHNHTAVNHMQKTKDIIAMVPDGGNYKDLPESLHRTRKVNIAWTRMNSQKPCFTIDAGHNHHFHYKANRVPTVRECARIQSFPDNFIFIGNRTSQYRQVGNAVPPLLGYALAKEAEKVLKDV